MFLYEVIDSEKLLNLKIKSKHERIILDPRCVLMHVPKGDWICNDNIDNDIFELAHASGWTIRAKIHNDWYSWIQNFEAQHPIFGDLKGDFNDKVECTDKNAFFHFIKYHTPIIFDMYDI